MGCQVHSSGHDWEVDVLASFFTLLYTIRLDHDGEDKLLWSPSCKGKFDVRSFYNILAYKDTVLFPWKSIWQTKVPLKVVFFAWVAALGKIITLDNLIKRQVIVIDRCCMCKKSGESVDHLLFHCEVACVLWNAIFSHFNLSWVMPRRWLIYLHVGRQLVALKVRLCRRWFFVVSYSACGRNATIDSSRTKKESLRSSFLFSFILCTLGWMHSLPY